MCIRDRSSSLPRRWAQRYPAVHHSVVGHSASSVSYTHLDVYKRQAYDIALMSRELILKHPDIRRFTTLWMDSLRGGEFQLANKMCIRDRRAMTDSHACFLLNKCFPQFQTAPTY